MGCLFENNNKISTCKIDEDKKEVCSKIVKAHGCIDCIYIKTNNKQDDLIGLNELIEESKEREKLLEKNIGKFRDDETLRALWMVNRSYIRLLENIEKNESSKMKNNEIKEYKIHKKDAKDMSNLEVINEQITRIISKMNGEDYLHITGIVMLSEELRELVKLRDELERIENLRKQREQLKKRQAEMVEEYREKRKMSL